MNAESPSEAKLDAQESLGLYSSSLFRKCSNCGRTGHNSRTCLEARADQASDRVSKATEKVSPGPGVTERQGDVSEISADHSKAKECRKKGVAWTEEEHKKFLAGLQKLGKGNWRGISRHFVPSKSPTQVASHAQKYFIRQTGAGKRKRRSSLFDIVPDADPQEEMAKARQMISSNSTSPANDPEVCEVSSQDWMSGGRPQMPVGPPPAYPGMVQNPEAFAWACWYQSMMLQQNAMNWISPMLTQLAQSHEGKPNASMPLAPPIFSQDGQQALSQAIHAMSQSNKVPGLPLGSLPGGPQPANGAAAAMAFWAAQQQQQMAAIMAATAMNTISNPEQMAELYRQNPSLRVPATAWHEDSSQPQAQAVHEGKDRGGLTQQQQLKIETGSSKPYSSDGSRDSDSPERDTFGHGTLVKPTAQKAKPWNLGEMPSYVTEDKNMPSASRISQSTQITSRSHPGNSEAGFDAGAGSSLDLLAAATASESRSTQFGADFPALALVKKDSA